MRKIITIAHVTLDGVMQAPGGPAEDPSGGFTQGGWAMRFSDEAVRESLAKIMAGEFDLLLGRRTYDIWAPYWPAAGDHTIARAFNRATKYVVTHRLDRLAWANSQPLSGDVVDRIRRLKATDGPELHLWGSSQLLQTLIAADLIDEFRLWVYPVVLGQGKRLFENGAPPRGLSLVASQCGRTGILLNTYRLAGPPPTAAVQPENPSHPEEAPQSTTAATAI